jgi:hypothetical protein
MSRAHGRGVSKDGPRASWFETREDALLTMRSWHLNQTCKDEMQEAQRFLRSRTTMSIRAIS